MTARLLTTQANAHAIAGDHRSFRTTINRDRTAMDHADQPGRPTWTACFTPAHLAGTAMRSLLALDRPAHALDFAPQPLAAPENNLRTNALHTALLATVHARAGGLDAAADHSQQALALARHVRSRRVAARLRQLTKMLVPHGRAAAVATFLERSARSPMGGYWPE
ncbi:hypothetical protein [Actinomadura sp. 3N407]|uniref:hypothetical protein n=1 Tax=Actinomadura sp. 3N407 TaxID=3457423 RepID=UPI003FCC9719